MQSSEASAAEKYSEEKVLQYPILLGMELVLKGTVPECGLRNVKE